ncbi:unnamed protein product [Prorocentrum cordatum]|uniref:Pentatricopeptide repeat-containing protein n=1 Tax=Prorocentrum cordatum TaxID=2364126 RepID=A0ABN9YC95_9DINO|nr:unnamed protein product [Polarella glacialis]
MAMLVEPGAIEHMYVVCLVQAILAQAISATRICGSLRSTLSFRMLDFGRGSRESAISLEALIKNCGRTKQWSAALRLLRDAIRFDVQLVPSHYIATVSACRKGGQWQHALSVLSEMWEAKLEPNVISYSAGISACEKEGRAVAAGLSAAERDAKARRHLLQRWNQRVRERRSVAAGTVASERDAAGKAGARCHQLQRWDQRVREMRAVAASTGAAQ